ncbi:MAG: GAF domain-containing protein [Sulfurimonas sp.]|jgi:signal transduction protein with GAF and PtsI domain|nr:GAF domain-containing protein [Sulfurimonas sp.]MBU1217689.1 GAF domain-containing protein [bacterium]MBU1434283.1 GAF domain-containing protein [bacterium]MBU1503674.1 GAF domain-containing protein [bacterium]MBU3939492.1 GAF domain-containing protein [bacterium]
MKYKDTYAKLAQFGRELLHRNSLVEGMPLISKYVKEVIQAERCSIFMYDFEKQELWTTLSDGVEKIKVASNKGIVGHTLNVKKPVLENNPYSNAHFLSDVDKETGYTTHNLITAPIFNSKRQIIGILELLNKEGGFDEEDVKFMIFFAHYVSGFLELTSLYLKEDSK